MCARKTEVRCTACGRRYRITEEYAGEVLPCPFCGGDVPIPGLEAFGEPQVAKGGRKRVAALIVVGCTVLGACAWLVWWSGVVARGAAWWRAWEPGTVREKPVPVPPAWEKELSGKVWEALDLGEKEKREVNEILSLYAQRGYPAAPAWPEVCAEQQRNVNSNACFIRYKIDKLIKKKGGEEGMFEEAVRLGWDREFVYAFLWKRERKYFDWWKRYMLRKIAGGEWGRLFVRHDFFPGWCFWEDVAGKWYDREDRGNAAATAEEAARLLEWLFLGEERDMRVDPGVASLVGYAYKRTGAAVRRMRDGADAAAVLYASRLFGDTCFGERVRKAALALLRKRGEEGMNLARRAREWRHVVGYIALRRREGRSVPAWLWERGESLTEEIAVLLEPDGCLPQVDGVWRRSNMRETVYRAGKLYGRSDFLFIASGAMRMAGTYPPSVRSVCLPRRGICVMRNTWNISPYLHERNDAWLGEDTVSVTVDMRGGEISFYGYVYPLCVVKTEEWGRMAGKPVWRSEEGHDYLRVDTDRQVTEVYFVKKEKTVLIRTVRTDGGKVRRRYYFFRSHLREEGPHTVRTVHFQRIFTHVAGFGFLLVRKQGGCVRVWSSGARRIEEEKDASEVEKEGCYWEMSTAGGKEGEVIMTALPERPQKAWDVDMRDLRWYRVEKKGDGTYLVSRYRQEYPLNIPRDVFPGDVWPVESTPVAVWHLQVRAGKVTRRNVSGEPGGEE